MPPVKQLPIEDQIPALLEVRGKSGHRFGELAAIILKHPNSLHGLEFDELEPLDSVKRHIIRMVKERKIELAFTTGGPICFLPKYIDESQIGKNILSLMVVKEGLNSDDVVEVDWTQTILDIILQSPSGIKFDHLCEVLGCSMSPKSLGMRVGSLSKKKLIEKIPNTDVWARMGKALPPAVRKSSIDEPVVVESKTVMLDNYHIMTVMSIKVEVIGLPSSETVYKQPTKIRICTDCDTTTGVMYAASCMLTITDPYGGEYRIVSPEGKRLTIELM